MDITLTRDAHSYKFKAPDYLPDVGDVYVVQASFLTAGGVHYDIGDELQIVCRTDEAPHGILASIGNLYVIGKDKKITIWSNIELAIRNGDLKLKVVNSN